jgi:hypothetical protein
MLDEMTERVRQAIREAEAAGETPPGRPTLIKLTGLNEYQVRKAQEKLAAAGDEGPPADSSDSPADPDGGPDTDEIPAVVEPEPVTADSAGDELETLEIQPADAGEPDLQPVSNVRPPRRWPLLLMSLAGGVAVWSGWVGLGKLTGFGMIQPLPGIADNFQLNTSIVLPISVEAYAAYALQCWLSAGRFSRRTTRFAKYSAFSSLVIGAGAQVAYHLMSAAGMTRAPWQITTLVATVPVVVLGLASALAKLVSSDLQRLQRVSSGGGQR